MVAHWAERAKADQPTAARVHHDVLIDHMPVFLWELGRTLADDGQPSTQVERAAEVHGDQRWETGWSLGEVVRDYQILRVVLVEYLEQDLNRPLASRESMVLSVAIDDAISASVSAYSSSLVKAVELVTPTPAADARPEELLTILGLLGHELRNPLAPLGNGLQLLKVAAASPAQLEKTRLLMERQFNVMTRLVDDMMDVPRLARGKLSLQRDRLDLTALVRECAEDRREALKGAGIRLAVDLPEAPTWTSGDGTRLAQAIGNLLTNAQKFTDHGGEVRVQLVVDEGRRIAVVRVRDTGIGIEPTFLPKVFESFMQAERSVNRSRGGLGLGLALVKGIVEHHGGTVRALSDGVGKGAEFVLDLPLIGHLDAVGPRDAQAAPTASTARRILLIEDNRDSAESLRMYLELFGHEVAVAHSGPEGMSVAERFLPDVVVCDIGLPGMDGIDVCLALRAVRQLADALVIALTGHGSGSTGDRIQSAGFDAVLLKPIDPEQLARMVAEYA
ncbi:ATP-binding response regulator [Limnoglobus roseus]|uniref:ATP-binding response regulator n=1 Tax=Limnoglobus roseus TaxID=2598579 RepID=UPI00143D4B6C|nr:hybrid sensor histidine kinase/response regulator [Limnoglobus roseus]